MTMGLRTRRESETQHATCNTLHAPGEWQMPYSNFKVQHATRYSATGPQDHGPRERESERFDAGLRCPWTGGHFGKPA
jgi:hypothetical protein